MVPLKFVLNTIYSKSALSIFLGCPGRDLCGAELANGATACHCPAWSALLSARLTCTGSDVAGRGWPSPSADTGSGLGSSRTLQMILEDARAELVQKSPFKYGEVEWVWDQEIDAANRFEVGISIFIFLLFVFSFLNYLKSLLLCKGNGSAVGGRNRSVKKSHLVSAWQDLVMEFCQSIGVYSALSPHLPCCV